MTISPAAVGRAGPGGDGGRMCPAAVMVAAAGAGHVPAPAALNSAKRSPVLAPARTVTRLAWPSSRGAGGAGASVGR